RFIVLINLVRRIHLSKILRTVDPSIVIGASFSPSRLSLLTKLQAVFSRLGSFSFNGGRPTFNLVLPHLQPIVDCPESRLFHFIHAFSLILKAVCRGLLLVERTLFSHLVRSIGRTFHERLQIKHVRHSLNVLLSLFDDVSRRTRSDLCEGVIGLQSQAFSPTQSACQFCIDLSGQNGMSSKCIG